MVIRVASPIKETRGGLDDPAARHYCVWVTESGNNSVVECDLAKVEVAGSNPVSRSIFFGGIAKW